MTLTSSYYSQDPGDNTIMRIMRNDETVGHVHRILAFTKPLLRFQLDSRYWRYDDDNIWILPGVQGGTVNASL